MNAKECQAGDIVLVTGIVVNQNPGQTLMMCAGIGGSGTWSLVNSAEVTVIGRIPPAAVQPSIDAQEEASG